MKTDEYYLQYKHQKDQHTKEHCSHLTLRFVTDGTLLEEVINNPFIKEKIHSLYKEKPTDPDFLTEDFNRFVNALTIKELLIYSNSEFSILLLTYPENFI